MNVWDIAKAVGTGLLASNPLGAAALGMANAFLPEDEQLGPTATGTQALGVLDRLPPDVQGSLRSKEIDERIAQTEQEYGTLRAMLAADAATAQTTRPYIARHAFHVIAVTILITITLWAYGVLRSDETMVKTIVDGWPFVLAAVGPFVVLLHAYFGILRKEHKQRTDAALGVTTPNGIAGILATLVSKK